VRKARTNQEVQEKSKLLMEALANSQMVSRSGDSQGVAATGGGEEGGEGGKPVAPAQFGFSLLGSLIVGGGVCSSATATAPAPHAARSSQAPAKGESRALATQLLHAGNQEGGAEAAGAASPSLVARKQKRRFVSAALR
jgi:hypothetical protein